MQTITQPRINANVLLLIAAALWGCGNVAQKTVMDDLGPFTAVGLRCLLGALFILPFVRRAAGTQQIKNLAAHWKCLSVVAACFTLAMATLQIGFAGTSATNAGFLVNVSTVMTPLAAWILWREAPAAVVWPAAGLSLIGVFLLGGGAFTALNAGDAMCLVAAAFFSLWIVLLGKCVRASGSPALLTAVQFAAAGAVCLAIGLATEPVSFQGLINAAPELAFLGLFSTAFAYALQAAALRQANAATASIIVSAEAAFGAIAASLILGEQLTTLGLAGALLIAAGIIAIHLPSPLRLKQRLSSALDRMRAGSRLLGKDGHAMAALPMFM